MSTQLNIVMNISKLASTVIMATGISTLLLFAFVLCLYSGDEHSIDKAFSVTASFFGGIATLVAAYIATQLFNDWKEQHNKNIDSQFCMKIYDFIDFANIELFVISNYLRDYLSINDEKKLDYVDQLKTHSQRLLNLKDSSLIKLSNVSYFINKEEYELKYLPEINIIDENLQKYQDLYEKFILGNSYQGNIEKLENMLDDLMLHTRERLRAVVVELSKYYKA